MLVGNGDRTAIRTDIPTREPSRKLHCRGGGLGKDLRRIGQRQVQQVLKVHQMSLRRPKTLESKVAHAKERGLGGIMVWEVSHDATGKGSLTAAIRRALGI